MLTAVPKHWFSWDFTVMEGSQAVAEIEVSWWREKGVLTILSIFILPAILFALAYYPIVTKLSRGLVSPYMKADVKKRLFAASIDGFLVVTSCYIHRNSDVVLYLAAGAVYLLFRDAIKGQSIGKFLLGLVVISLETGHPSSLAGSVRRNALLLLPGANVVAIFLEAGTIIRDPQGQRLGDRLAQTQVIEGLGAKDLVKSFQDLFMRFGVELGRAGERQGRVWRNGRMVEGSGLETLRVVTYSVMDGWRLVLAHDRRHFEQARRVTQSPGFPD